MEILYLRALQAMLLSLCAYLLVQLGLRWSRARAVSALWMALLFAGSLLVRWSLASFGPGDIRHNTAHVLRPLAMDWMQLGSTPPALFDLLLVFLPRTHETIVHTNLVVGSLAPLLMVALARELGFSRSVSLAGGVALAVMPLPVLFAGTANRQMLQVFLLLFSLWTLARYQSGGRVLDFAVSVIALLLLVQNRPESLLFVVFWMGACFLLERMHPGGMAAPYGMGLVVGFCVVYYLLVLAGSGTVTTIRPWEYLWFIPFSMWNFPPSQRELIVLNTEYTPYFYLALFGASLMLVVVQRRWTRLMVFVSASIAVSSLAFLAMPTSPAMLTDARYQVAMYVFLVLGTLPALEGFTSAFKGRKQVLAWAVLAAVAIPPTLSFRYLFEDRAVDAEFHFILASLDGIPQNAEIYYAHPDHYEPEDLELELHPGWTDFGLLRGAGKEGTGPEWLPWPPTAPASDRPRFYYRSANCLTVPHTKYFEVFPSRHAESFYSPVQRAAFEQHMASCEEALRITGGLPLREEVIPGRTYAMARFRDNWIPIGFYRIPEAYPGRGE